MKEISLAKFYKGIPIGNFLDLARYQFRPNCVLKSGSPGGGVLAVRENIVKFYREKVGNFFTIENVGKKLNVVIFLFIYGDLKKKVPARVCIVVFF